ncbi:hypothetical protein NUSPORA_02607 [Nucleospora cyclopteri]
MRQINENRVFEVSIPKYQNVKRYTEYQIVVVAQHKYITSDCFFIYRRYSEFLKLHKILEKDILYLPDFPPKVFLNKKKEILEDRRKKFDLYLKYVTSFIIRNKYERCDSGRALFKFLSPTS